MSYRTIIKSIIDNTNTSWYIGEDKTNMYLRKRNEHIVNDLIDKIMGIIQLICFYSTPIFHFGLVATFVIL